MEMFLMTTSEFLNSYVPADLKQMQGWAKAGQPDRILKEILERRNTYAPTAVPGELLSEALDQAGRQSPEQLVAASFQQMIAMGYGVQMRLHHLMQGYLRECDQFCNSLQIWEYVAAHILPLIERADRQMVKLTKEYAAAKRWLDLPEWTDILTAQDETPPEGPSNEPADATDAAPAETPQVQATDELAETQPGA
jgi:hypothetical protein